LLMGTDMFLTFHQWWKPEEIVKYVSLAMAHRADPSEQEQAAITAQKMWLEQELGAKAEIVQNDLIEISSTAVRSLLLLGAGEDVLPEAVYGEILRQGLYRTGESLRNLPTEQLRKVSLSLHKAKRIPHVEGCCRLAVSLAERWGADPEQAARAAILHDCTKMFSATEQLILCRRYDILLDDFDRQNESLLHAKTAAAVAARVFGEAEEICSAIRWHTTGRAGMTKLEKIVYLADMIEETRSYDGVEELRLMAQQNLDGAVRLALRRTIEFVQSGGRLLHPDSGAALRYEEERSQISDRNNEVDK